MESEILAGLDVIVRPGRKQDSAVLFLHGFGADMHDLFPLADLMDPAGTLPWYFPNAGLDILIAPGFRGRAWYPIDMSKYEKLLRGGQVDQITKTRPQGMDQALALLLDLLATLQKRHKKIILGGFSQGAIMTLEAALKAPKSPDALVLMSGSLVDEDSWRKMIPGKKGMPYIQSHGSNDPILSFEVAKKLSSLLNQSGWRGDLVSFSGGHEIPPQVIERIKKFIEKQVQ